MGRQSVYSPFDIGFPTTACSVTSSGSAPVAAEALVVSSSVSQTKAEVSALVSAVLPSGLR